MEAHGLLWESASFYITSTLKRCRNVSRLCRRWKWKILKADCLHSCIVLLRWRVCHKQRVSALWHLTCCSTEQFRKEMEYAIFFLQRLYLYYSICKHDYWFLLTDTDMELQCVFCPVTTNLSSNTDYIPCIFKE